jgi:hypothetical protein
MAITLIALLISLEALAMPFAFGPIWLGEQIAIITGLALGVVRNLRGTTRTAPAQPAGETGSPAVHDFPKAA